MTDGWAAGNERRGGRRFRVNAPVTVMAGDSEIAAVTQDVSNRGVYLLVSLADCERIGPEFDFMLEIPSEITRSMSCRILCRGRLLRREPDPGNMTGAGIAVEIVSYSMLNDATASPA